MENLTQTMTKVTDKETGEVTMYPEDLLQKVRTITKDMTKEEDDAVMELHHLITLLNATQEQVELVLEMSEIELGSRSMSYAILAGGGVVQLQFKVEDMIAEIGEAHIAEVYDAAILLATFMLNNVLDYNDRKKQVDKLLGR